MATPEALKARDASEVPEPIRQFVDLCASLQTAAADYAAEITITGQPDPVASGNIVRINTAAAGLLSALQQARMASAQGLRP